MPDGDRVRPGLLSERRQVDSRGRRLLSLNAKWSCILVVALDRLGRSVMKTISAVLSLDKAGVEFVSRRDSWLDVDSS